MNYIGRICRPPALKVHLMGANGLGLNREDLQMARVLHKSVNDTAVTMQPIPVRIT